MFCFLGHSENCAWLGARHLLKTLLWGCVTAGNMSWILLTKTSPFLPTPMTPGQEKDTLNYFHHNRVIK